jgi:branched-subunit amino acid transport protein
MTLFWTLIAGGLLTFAIRASFLFAPGQVERSQTLRRALRFVPIAILTALIASEVLIREDQLALTLSNERLWASLVAILVAWRTRNTLLTIAAGMGALGVWMWVIG